MSKQSEEDKKREHVKQAMKDCYPYSNNMSRKERAELRWKNFMEAHKGYGRFIK